MAHFTDEQIRGFSRRSAQIEEGLAAMGLTRETADAQTKSRVSMATRDKKQTTIRVKIFIKSGLTGLTSWESTSMICLGWQRQGRPANVNEYRP